MLSSTPHVPYPPPCSSSSTTSRLTSTAPYTFNSKTSLHLGSVVSLPHSIPLPHSFANTKFWHSTHPSSNERFFQLSAPSALFRSLSATQKQPSKAQPRCFRTLPVRPPTTLPFQRQLLDNYSTYPPLDTFRAPQVEHEPGNVDESDERGKRINKGKASVQGEGFEGTNQDSFEEEDGAPMDWRATSCLQSHISMDRHHSQSQAPESTSFDQHGLTNNTYDVGVPFSGMGPHSSQGSSDGTSTPSENSSESRSPPEPAYHHPLSTCSSPTFGSSSLPAASLHGFTKTNLSTPLQRRSFPQHDVQNEHLKISPVRVAPTVEHKSHVSLLMPNTQTTSPLSLKTYKLSPGMRNEQIQTEALLVPEVPMVHNEQLPSSTTCNDNSALSLTTLTSSKSIFWDRDPVETSTASPTGRDQATSTKLRMEEGFEKSSMARLIQEYSSVLIESQLAPMETSIMSVLSLEELPPDLIVDRGGVRNRRLPCYHLEKATMDDVCMAIMAQQVFLQQAAALIVDRKSHFIVDPGDTLTPILQGTSSLPQLYVAWKALITRIKLGVKAWEKYIAEYQLQADVAVLSLSTFAC